MKLKVNKVSKIYVGCFNTYLDGYILFHNNANVMKSFVTLGENAKNLEWLQEIFELLVHPDLFRKL